MIFPAAAKQRTTLRSAMNQKPNFRQLSSLVISITIPLKVQPLPSMEHLLVVQVAQCIYNLAKALPKYLLLPGDPKQWIITTLPSYFIQNASTILRGTGRIFSTMCSFLLTLFLLVPTSA